MGNSEMGKMESRERAAMEVDFKLFADFNDGIDRFYDLRKSELEPLGITSTQVKTLHYLVDHEGSSQQSVADEMCISRSGASDLLGQMEKKDLVARRLSSIDKRTAEVYLTDSGKAVGAKVKAAYERYCLSCMEDFSAEEIRLFIGLMSRFIRRSHICEDIIEDEPPSGARDADSSLTFRKCSARVLM